MARSGSASLKLIYSSTSSTRDNADRADVVLHGEHDIATVADLTQTLRRATAAVNGDLVVDLADVDFMGAAAVGVFIRASEELRRRNHMLFLRSPNSSAQRVLKVCGFAPLADWGALATWVAVPATEREGSDARAPTLTSVETAYGRDV